MRRLISRGDIFLANLSPVIGSEQGGVRPVVVLQNNIGNYFSDTTIVAVMTTHFKNKPNLPTHIFVPKEFGLKKDSIIMLEQIRTIDKARLIRQIGNIGSKEQQILNRSLTISLGL